MVLRKYVYWLELFLRWAMWPMGLLFKNSDRLVAAIAMWKRLYKSCVLNLFHINFEAVWTRFWKFARFRRTATDLFTKSWSWRAAVSSQTNLSTCTLLLRHSHDFLVPRQPQSRLTTILLCWHLGWTSQLSANYFCHTKALFE